MILRDAAFGVGEALAAVLDLGQRVGRAHPSGRLNHLARLQFLVDLEEVLDLQELKFRWPLGISMVTSKFRTPPLGHVDD